MNKPFGQLRVSFEYERFLWQDNSVSDIVEVRETGQVPRTRNLTEKTKNNLTENTTRI